MQRIARTTTPLSVIALAMFLFAAESDFRINQIGYYPTASKVAIVVGTTADSFSVIENASSAVVHTGALSAAQTWTASGETVKQADFSKVRNPGTYRVRVGDKGTSYPFSIAPDCLRDAARAATRSFYYQRCSYKLESAHAGVWARSAGHPDTACIYHSSSGKTSGMLSSPGGWYDAGDYGKYVVNAGVTMGYLLGFQENFPSYFPDRSLSIPESGNSRGDLIDEMKYELDWLKTMQDGDGGVFFKMTSLTFCGFIMPEADKLPRYVIGKSTQSTLDFAAVMAMAGRIYKQYDAAYAGDCVSRAIRAWDWAQSHPTSYYQQPTDVRTGGYTDGNATDEFIWAASELFITTGDETYRNYLSGKNLNLNGPASWADVRNLAPLSLATVSNGLDSSRLGEIRRSIVTTADAYLAQIAANPYRIHNTGFYWGSNGGIAGAGMVLAYAHHITKDIKYMKGAAEIADYLLGKNATGYCFLTGFGSNKVMHPHHRPSGADNVTDPVPGFIVGGPNSSKNDATSVTYQYSEAARSFMDVEASYASNEVAINWNAPVVALLGAVDLVLGGGGGSSAKPGPARKPPVMRGGRRGLAPLMFDMRGARRQAPLRDLVPGIYASLPESMANSRSSITMDMPGLW